MGPLISGLLFQALGSMRYAFIYLFVGVIVSILMLWFGFDEEEGIREARKEFDQEGEEKEVVTKILSSPKISPETNQENDESNQNDKNNDDLPTSGVELSQIQDELEMKI